MSTAPLLVESIFELDDTNLIAYNRKKTDYIRIAPSVRTIDYANTSGAMTAINFEINNQQYFLYLLEAFVYCEFDLYKKETGKAEVILKPEDNYRAQLYYYRAQLVP